MTENDFNVFTVCYLIRFCSCGIMFIKTRVIRMNKNFSFEKVWCSYDHMSLSRDRIWHYFSMKPYTEIATTTFVLDKNRTEKTNFPI